MTRSHLIDGDDMTNEEIKNLFNDLYGGWWKKYRDISPVTDDVCDKAFNDGKQILEKYGAECKLAIDVFVDLLEELNKRRLGGG